MSSFRSAISFAASLAGLANYTRLQNTDINPCIGPCIRVGNCGYNFNVSCDVSLIADICDKTCGCIAFNSNGWLKGCANTSCGIAFEEVDGTDSYFRGDGMPPAAPDQPVIAQDDVWYPPEEPAEAASSSVLSVSQTSIAPDQCWALLQVQDPSAGPQTLNVTCGSMAFGYTLLAILPSLTANTSVTAPVAVLERLYSRWGFYSYVAQGAAPGTEIVRVRKGTGTVTDLVMPNYNYLLEEDCLYWNKVDINSTDYIRARVMIDTNGQPTFAAAQSYMAPQRDYAHIGGIVPYQKYSVAPDGRIKLADGAIWTTDNLANETGPGTLIFDPLTYLPVGCWPLTNFTYSKSALVGGHLRVVSVTSYSPTTGNGFEQVAFAPASDPSNLVYISLQPVMANATGVKQYYLVDAKGTVTAGSNAAFYDALYSEYSLWQSTLTNGYGTNGTAATYALPGQEGHRQIDMTWGGIVSGMSLFVDLEPNYGDGEDYWTPGGNNGGNLPFQTWNLNIALQNAGLMQRSADLLAFYYSNYIVNGTYSTGTWETSCPDAFADAIADHGILMTLLVRSIRLVLASNGLPPAQARAWAQAQMVTLANMSVYALNQRANATSHTPPGSPIYGLLWGSPEHDLCRLPDYYYHNQVWYVRGMREAAQLIVDICEDLCPQYSSLGPALSTEAGAFYADIKASIQQTATYTNTSQPYFIPHIAAKGIAPYKSMIESTLSEYSNFRFWSELLGADILPPECAVAVMNFREATTGTVSGITRWSDHLDNMPAVHYFSSALWYGRQSSFWMMQYGHMANYHGRGTWTATEQIPIGPDANGFYRDYLWSYLEGGIDECVPSITLTALGTQMALVMERYEQSALYIGWGAPSRWVAPAEGGTTGSYGVQQANTIFGIVSVNVSCREGSTPGTEVSTAFITYTGTGSPGVSQQPSFSVRLVSYAIGHSLQEGSVTVTGPITVQSVDAAAGTVMVALQQPNAGSPTTLSVQGEFS